MRQTFFSEFNLVLDDFGLLIQQLFQALLYYLLPNP